MGLTWFVSMASLIGSLAAIFGAYLYSRRSGQSVRLTDLDVHLRVLREQLDDTQTKLADANKHIGNLTSENVELLRKLVRISNGNGEK